MNTSTRITRGLPVVGLLAVGLILSAQPIAAQVSLGSLGAPYSENFDALAASGTSNSWKDNSTLPGWYVTGTTYLAGTGTEATGGLYSFGAAATDRSLGSICTKTTSDVYYGLRLKNDTRSIITSLLVSFTGEQWRSAGCSTVQCAALSQRLDFSYQAGFKEESLLAGSWTDVDQLDFVSPVYGTSRASALDGNAAANRTELSALIQVALSPGEEIVLRWKDRDDPDSDHGLAIDNVSVVPFGGVIDPAPYVSSTVPPNNAVDVSLAASITVTFSEPVNVSGNWFQLACATSGTRSVSDTTVNGGPTTFTIDPTADFASSETCTLTIFAALVTDQDTDDPDDAMAADYSSVFTTIAADNAPAVAGTIPADGATNVPPNQSIVVNFTEPVNVTDPWFTITCAPSGAHSAVVTGGPTSFTLNPTLDYQFGDICTLAIDPSKVTDQDTDDPPDNMAFSFTAGFTVEPDPCTLPFTPIYTIQGSGPTAAVTGVVTTQGVVVGDYEYPGSGSTGSYLRGFFLQDLNGDADPATSDGIFVFNGNNNSVALGDVVRVTGTAGDYQDQTQISNVTLIRKCGTGSVSPVDVTLPVPSATHLERYEGMLVRLPQTLFVTDNYYLGRFGAVSLSANGRLAQPTNVVAPGAPALALQAQNDLNSIILDDDSQAQNPDPILFARGGLPLSAGNTLRGGDTAAATVGVMTYTWAGNAASGNAYRVRPVGALDGAVSFQPSNPRPASAPPVGGAVKVASMSLLNFFNTFADGNPGTPGCFPSGTDADCRGANSAAEFARQYSKTVAAIVAISPDVLGVLELENDGYGPESAIQFLVDQLNAATAPGTYAFINVDTNTGQVNALGDDAIRTGLLYRPAAATPVGQTAVLNAPAFVNGGDMVARNRPSLAQAFRVNASGSIFIVDINHLKSKGSACDAPDSGDGQGNCNQVRVNAATALMNWLATDPTGTGDPDILLIGDYNSYAQEDPITVIKNAGFANMIEAFLGPDAYAYGFDGQWGYLDQALASAQLSGRIAGVGTYHINADEPSVLDYNVEFKSAGQIAGLYAPDQYRTSDHDPIVVGLNLNSPPSVDAGGPYSVDEGSSVTLAATGSDPDGDPLTYDWDLDDNGTFETAGQSVTFSAAMLDGPSSHFVRVRATDSQGLQAVAGATVNVLNVSPTVGASFGSVSVGCGANNAILTATFTDPGVADSHTVVIAWGDGAIQTFAPATSPLVVQHTYALAGAYSATVTATDDDGGSGSSVASTNVRFNTTGILDPINPDGTSVFKYKSTIPVKIRFTDCNGAVPANLAPTIKVALMSGAVPVLNINEPVSTSAADTTGIMRFSTDQYIYNLATRPLPDPSATYRITITVPSTGQTASVDFGLRP